MKVLKAFWQSLLYLMGFPRPATDDQKQEKLITMRESRDCLVAAIATMCGVTYEQAYKACWHFNLPFLLESPLLSNPLNAVRALRSLGKSTSQRTLSELLNGACPVGKTLVLIHDPRNAIAGTFLQHWVVFMGVVPGGYSFHWGQSQELKIKTRSELIDLVTSGTPNCIIWIS